MLDSENDFASPLNLLHTKIPAPNYSRSTLTEMSSSDIFDRNIQYQTGPAF